MFGFKYRHHWFLCYPCDDFPDEPIWVIRREIEDLDNIHPGSFLVASDAKTWLDDMVIGFTESLGDTAW